MALKKDTTLVWISDASRAGRRAIVLAAAPSGAKKELDARLKAAYGKKVKGARLESLRFDLLEEATVPFAKEYLQTLFRIADFSVLEACCFESAPMAEAKSLDWLGASLKEQFPDSDFEICFDPRYVRKSVLSRWMKKQQIPGKALEGSLPDNLALQTTHFLAMLACAGPGEDFGLKSMVDRQFGFLKKWAQSLSEAIYLRELKPEQQNAARLLFERVPVLLTSGTFDSWMRKGIDTDALEKTARLYELGMPEESILALNPRRIRDHYQTLAEQLESAHKPFPEEAFVKWSDRCRMQYNALLSERHLIDKALPWEKLIRRLLDKWLDNPSAWLPDKMTAWVFEDQGKMKLYLSAYAPWLRAAQIPEPIQSLVYVHALPGEPAQMFQAVCKYHPAKIKTTKSLLTRLHTQSVLSNVFVPIYLMDGIERENLLAMPDLNQAQPRAGAVQSWLSDMVRDYLEDEQLAWLASQPFTLLQTRLLARAFLKGLPLVEAARQWEQSDHEASTIYQLTRPYLYNTRQQIILDDLRQEDWLELLARPSWSAAQLGALERLLEDGIDQDWLALNVKGKTTVRQIQNLRQSYPYGQIPASWNVFLPMPEELANWLCEQAVSAHPQLHLSKIEASLLSFVESLCAQLFALPVSSSAYLEEEEFTA